MNEIKATAVQTESSVRIVAQVRDSNGAVILSETVEFPRSDPQGKPIALDAIARETRLLLQAKLAGLPKDGAGVAIPGLDGETI